MAEPRRRRLAAIMFTDIVGYSSIMQQDEAKGRTLRDRHRRTFESHTADHQGEIIQYYGDGTLSVFESAVAAVECAVCIQKSLNADPPVPVRIGIHLGDIHFDNTEVYGHGVNVAARIEPICLPGGIFISDKVFDEIKNHPSLKAKALGAFEFKNIDHEVGLYAVSGRGIPVPSTADIALIKEKTKKNKLASAAEKSEAIKRHFSTKKANQKRKTYRWVGIAMLVFLAFFAVNEWQDGLLTLDPIPDDAEISIAVLPFANMSTEADNEYFSDGMTEDILTLLSKIQGLSVTSRTSIMQYKDTEKDTRRIARELKVNHLLEGSVRREGNQVRITAQLIDAINDNHLWAKTYDEELTSIFSVQSQVAEDIAKHLQKNLAVGDREQTGHEKTKDYVAYDKYLKGREHYRKYTEHDNEQAIEYFNAALAIDPGYSNAMAGLGDAYAQKGTWGSGQENYLDSSIEISRKAISIDPDLSEGHKALGLAYQYQGKMDSALAEYKMAIKLDPNNDMASNNIGMLYRKKGDFKESAKWLYRTFDINKNLPSSTMNLAGMFLEIGDDQTAKSIIDSGLAAHPDNSKLQLVKGEILLRSGNIKEAKKVGTKLIADESISPNVHAFLGDVFLREKDWEKAGEHFAEAMTELEAKGERSEILEAQYALVEFKQGNKELAEKKWTGILDKVERKEKSAENCLLISGIYASMGKKEKALSCLKEAQGLDWHNYKAGAGHPAFDILQGDPIYEKIIKEVQEKSDSLLISIKSLEMQASR